VPITLFKS